MHNMANLYSSPTFIIAWTPVQYIFFPQAFSTAPF